MISAETNTNSLLSGEEKISSSIVRKSKRAVLEFNMEGRVTLHVSLKGANDFTLIGLSVLTAQLLNIHWSKVKTANVYAGAEHAEEISSEELIRTIQDITSICNDNQRYLLTIASCAYKSGL
jgi:hypothetical protein